MGSNQKIRIVCSFGCLAKRIVLLSWEGCRQKFTGMLPGLGGLKLQGQTGWTEAFFLKTTGSRG